MPYKNEGVTDFSVEENKEAMLRALERVRSGFGRTYPLCIGGHEQITDSIIESRNPSNPDEIVGRVYAADEELAGKAVETAAEAFDSWSRKSARYRADCLIKAAAIMRRRKFELSAIMVYEAGKPWLQADADIAEAIDFLEYYAREAMRLHKGGKVHPYPGESTNYRYIPLGVGAIIPPWNFPSAILTGMTSAALVSGNTVVLKPASATPIIGAKVAEILYDAGIPGGVLNFVPGSGSTVGDALVKHPLTRFVSFTGSLEVGTNIYESAAIVREGQHWLKRVITEMGGKDALIVDDPCDCALAADAAVTSAFGYQGQKCSACSRVIVVESVYNAFMKELMERVGELNVGDPEDADIDMGPVSSDEAYEKVMRYIAIGKEEATLAHGGGRVGKIGYFIEPTVFVDVDPHARIAQEEIFGPVLSVIKARDFDEALYIANDTIYGLTGGIITNDRDHIERTKNEFHVGNLYINRKITGSLVGVQPFGGYKMSGTCSKAGGPDYLLLFMQPKTIIERL